MNALFLECEAFAVKLNNLIILYFSPNLKKFLIWINIRLT